MPQVDESERVAPGLCAIAARTGATVWCPEGGCALLRALESARVAGTDAPPDLAREIAHELGYVDAGAACPVEALAGRSGFAPAVVATLEAVRRELEHGGAALANARRLRTRERRHEEVLARWGVR